MPDGPLPEPAGLTAPLIGGAARPGLCTDCGISRIGDGKACGRACQFIQPDHAWAEARVHGRARQLRGDEAFFGPYQSLWRARMRDPVEGAQWTGITTSLAQALLEDGKVDAVLTMAPHPEDRWRPHPVVITRPEDLAQCRGMRMGFAPLLSLVEPSLARGLKRLAVIAIPCQVYPLRMLEAEWRQHHGLESLYVIGTPCSDNTTTERFHDFLALVAPEPKDVTYLEFCADYHVEIRTRQGQVRRIPFLKLPLSELPADFFPLTCRTCVDYTNSLSDLTVGYMGGRGEQWLIVRNDQGEQLVSLLGSALRSAPPTSAGDRMGAVKGFIRNVERSAGGLPLQRMPKWLRPLVSWMMPRVGPRGLEFARARVQMKAAETVIHLRREQGQRVKHMVPPHIWRLVQEHGLRPSAQEQGPTA